ncbi:hypothetical protein LCGC14_0866270 [marine sediment metagenome]|uniref:Uncharacterized protein n=1 Tax=marine sediment metagenome TaxID=412755 RepID=A0A0F9SD32_9ZZZZ
MIKKFIIILLLCSVCSADSLSFSSNAGEWTPLLKYRTDQQKYYSACQTLENMIPLPQGATIRRPGTKYIAETKSSGTARLIAFEYATTDTYIIEMTNLAMRFYRNGGQIQDSGSAFEVVTVFTTSQLRDIQFVQINDVMYMVHPNVHPQKLTRAGHTSWTIADVDFQKGPFTDENTTTTTISASAKTGTVTLTASVSLFNSNHIGSLWKLIHIKAAERISGSHSGDGNSSTITVQEGREWEFVTHGTWTGRMVLEKNYNSEGWLTEYATDSANDDNRHEVGIEDEGEALYRVTMENHSAGTATYSFIAYALPIDGVVTITAVASATSATATVQATLGNTIATKRWAEGAWNIENGYPRTVGLFQNRAMYGGTDFDPIGLWLSASAGDYENMYLPTASPDDDDAIVYVVASAKQNPIEWVLDSDNIMVGTNGGIIQVGDLGSDGPVTGDNIASRAQTGLGSAHIMPQRIEDAILFVERNGAKIRRLIYSLEKDSYSALDMTILSEHFFDSEIVEIAVQNRPEPILWCVLTDGTLLGMTFQQEHDVVAWHTHPIDGDVESVAVIPSTSSDEDEVWLSIERTIDSSSVTYVEQMQPQDWGSDQDDMWFVDSGLQYDSTPATTISGLGHLEGELVQVFGDGGYFEEETVVSGSITISQAVSQAQIGLGYTSNLETMPFEVFSRSNSTVGRSKRITNIGIGFFNSLQCEYGWDGGVFYPVQMYVSDGTLTGGAPELVNRFIPDIPFAGNSDVEAAIWLRQTKPYPMGITAITAEVDYGD